MLKQNVLRQQGRLTVVTEMHAFPYDGSNMVSWGYIGGRNYKSFGRKKECDPKPPSQLNITMVNLT